MCESPNEMNIRSKKEPSRLNNTQSIRTEDPECKKRILSISRDLIHIIR